MCRHSRLGRGVPVIRPSVVAESSMRMTASVPAGTIAPIAIWAAVPSNLKVVAVSPAKILL